MKTVFLDSRLASSWAVPLVDEFCSEIGCWLEFTHLYSGRKWTKGAASKKMKAGIRQLLLTTEVGFVENGEIRKGVQFLENTGSLPFTNLDFRQVTYLF